jgi:hypothetical protein
MRRTKNLLFAGIWVALALASCRLLEPERRPARPEGPVFDHAGHIQRGLECANCHGEAGVAFKAMPTLESCLECHEDLDKEKPPEKGARIFFDEGGQGMWIHAGAQDPEIRFDHGAHQKEGMDCLTCHKEVAESTFIPAGKISMDACIACHAVRAPEYNDCASCHREIRRDRPPKSHHLGWKTEHGRVAREGSFDPLPAECSLCHLRSDCDTCHRAEKPKNHNMLWRFHGHAAMASIDRDNCSICHTTDSCASCHKDALPRSHRGGFGAPNNHHCLGCHLPLTRFGEEGCAVCHRGTPSHASAPPRPANEPHMTNNPADCRECHMVLQHPDNGQSCLFCHQ